MKHIFKSKTAMMALITSLAGIAAVFIPEADQFIATHSAELLVALGAVNLVIRVLTKEAVSLFPGN